jgi:TPR repeat protein
MRNLDQDDMLRKACEKMHRGAYRAAYKLLAPLIREKCADALYLYSTFSFLRKETIEEFEKRSLAMVQQAASMGHPQALYCLALRFDVGDVVEKNPEKASVFFKLAAEAGHAKAKESYGLDLFYGTNGIAQNQSLGLAFLQEAVDEGVDGAEYCLEKAKAHVLK